MRITEDYDVRRASMFLKLLRNSYSSSGKSFASQPFDIRKLFGLIQELEDRMANVVIENQDFETLIRHYDRPDAFFYADPPYFSTEDMYEVGFGWDDHVRLRETLGRIKGKFLLSYNDCPEIRELYDGFSLFDFSRTHSMAQRYEAGKEFKELLIANYDYYERENAKPKQLTLFDIYGDENYDYEKNIKGEHYIMQNQMKSQPLFALVPVPYEALVDAGIEIGDPLQFTVKEGKVTMEKISPEDMDFVCDGNCEGCPMLLLDCTGECAVCPCNDFCDESEVF